MFRYRVYGLTIESDSRFAELSSLEKPTDRMATDVRVRLKSRGAITPPFSEILQTTTLPDGTPWLISAKIHDGYLLRYAGIADFIVDSAGAELRCCRVERGVSADSVRHLVLDQVFPMLLNRRGREALHATAIVTSRGACAFSGPAGSGKSTLAASFFLAGFGALGDDCLPLVEQIGSIGVLPGYPGMRLWNDALEALSTGSGATTPVASYTSKRRALQSASAKNFPREPVALSRIYRVMRPKNGEPEISAPVIESLGPREAFIELVSSSFPLDLADPEMLTRHFRLMEKVASTVPVKRLRVPNDLTALCAIREAVLSDLMR
jgi:hypothetical protein